MNNSDSANELQALVQVIYGEPASKSNSRRVVKFGGMPRLIKSEKALTYSDTFREQCTQLATLMSGDLRVTLHIYYASRRPDLDETLILDLMQGLIPQRQAGQGAPHLLAPRPRDAPLGDSD